MQNIDTAAWEPFLLKVHTDSTVGNNCIPILVNCISCSLNDTIRDNKMVVHAISSSWLRINKDNKKLGFGHAVLAGEHAGFSSENLENEWNKPIYQWHPLKSNEATLHWIRTLACKNSVVYVLLVSSSLESQAAVFYNTRYLILLNRAKLHFEILQRM